MPQRPVHRLVVHVRLVLVSSPQPGHGLALHQLEHAEGSVQPLDIGRTAVKQALVSFATVVT